MSLLDAVVATGIIPPDSVSREEKKRFSERLSSNLAPEVAEGLRAVGFRGTKPLRGGPGEKAFQGGFGPKQVDVSYSDERHGLLLAISIKSINFQPFGKNLANRFADLCTEAINLHLRFPYAVVCGLFAFPIAADQDVTKKRTISTFQRATTIFASISGRQEYTDPPEKFEHFAMMPFQPVTEGGASPTTRVIDATSGREISEREYVETVLRIYNKRNPQSMIINRGDIEE